MTEINRNGGDLEAILRIRAPSYQGFQSRLISSVIKAAFSVECMFRHANFRHPMKPGLRQKYKNS